MAADPHSAVRTAVDEARRLVELQPPFPWRLDHSDLDEVYAADNELVATAYALSSNQQRNVAAFIAAWNPSRALAMCDWADDVLARHAHSVERRALTPFDPYTGERRESEYDVYCEVCGWSGDGPNGACAEVKAVAAAFGVETGETE